MGGRGSCRANNGSERRVASSEWLRVLEGSAPALPFKFSVVREHDPPVNGSQTPNKFGAQKFRHQPLAKASGMDGIS